MVLFMFPIWGSFGGPTNFPKLFFLSNTKLYHFTSFHFCLSGLSFFLQQEQPNSSTHIFFWSFPKKALEIRASLFLSNSKEKIKHGFANLIIIFGDAILFPYGYKGKNKSMMDPAPSKKKNGRKQNKGK